MREISSIEFQDRHVQYFCNMTRSIAVENTLTRAQKYVESGILCAPERIDFDEKFGVPTYVCCHKIARDQEAPPLKTTNIRRFIAGHAMGKGQTVEQSQASAMCEALERYCATTWADRDLITATYADVRDCALSPNELVEFTPESFSRFKNATSNPQNCRNIFGHERMRPFGADLPMHWVRGFSLIKNKPVLVPAYQTLIFAEAPQNVFTCAPMNTDGLSLGNNLEEAVLQGFYEGLERDAIMIFMRNMVSLPDVDLDTTASPFVGKIRAICDDNGIDLSVKDFTSDFGIPVYFAQFYDERNNPDYFFGFGSHLDPDIALVRAITEAFQGRSSYAWLKKHFAKELNGAKVLPPHAALITAGPKAVSIHEHQTRASENLKTDLAFCLERVKSLGMDVVVVDLSVPEIDFTAVKVLIVGSAYCDTQENPFFLSSRVFSVPQKMGLTNGVPTENELYLGPLIT